MCGLVGVAGNIITKCEIDIFEQMLYADAFRGFHSTGVAAYTKDTYKVIPNFRPYHSHIHKKAITSADFLSSRDYTNWRDNLKVQKDIKVLMGHNRWATQGAIDHSNSHPFEEGHIILSHNGTLRNMTNLPDHVYFDVDSNLIAHSIQKIGVKETVKLLDGAFVLTWIDTREHTLNFIRNTERPFSFYTNSFNDIIWGSESLMVDWIINRNKRSGFKEWELSPGDWVSFDLTKTAGLNDFSVTKCELSKSIYRYNDYNRSYNTYGSNNNNNKERESIILPDNGRLGEAKRVKNKRLKRYKNSLAAYSIEPNKSLKFIATDWEPYSQSVSNSGIILGYLCEDPWLSAEIHNADKSSFLELGEYYVEAKCVRQFNGTPTLVGINPIEITETEEGVIEVIEEIPDEELDTLMLSCNPDNELAYTGPHGKGVNKKSMDLLTRGGCCNCQDDIHEHEYDEIHWMQNGLPMCETCYQVYENADLISDRNNRVH